MIYKYKGNVIFFDSKFVYNNLDELYYASPEDFEGFFGEQITEEDKENYLYQVTCVYCYGDTDAEKIKYNINVGVELIALFRQDFKQTELQTTTSIDVFQKLNGIIILLLTGSFREAAQLLSLVERDEFLTDERIQKYINCLKCSDALTYETTTNETAN